MPRVRRGWKIAFSKEAEIVEHVIVLTNSFEFLSYLFEIKPFLSFEKTCPYYYFRGINQVPISTSEYGIINSP